MQQWHCHGLHRADRAGGVEVWLYLAPHQLSHNEDQQSSKLFAKSKLPLNNWIFLLYLWSMDLWSMDVGVCTAALQAEVSEVTADVYQFCRDVCSTWLLNDGPTMLGGNGVVVQIDESLFVHKCKVSRKVIVLGGCNDCEYSNSKVT